jgi:hypothetical protein
VTMWIEPKEGCKWVASQAWPRSRANGFAVGG